MPPAGSFDQLFNQKCIFIGVLIAILLIFSPSGQADPAVANMPVSASSQPGHDGAELTLDELREHAATISAILDVASERVERLAADETGKPALVDAIKQELSLSRRWNRHIGSILEDVVEARRALGEREREAAREIARMTAVAEEARLELVALKKVLNRRPDAMSKSPEERSDSSRAKEASDRPVIKAMIEGVASSKGDLSEARAALASMQDVQESVARDVDAVRAKIIEALETLATVRGGQASTGSTGSDAGLSSEDITGWAASMATRLRRPSDVAPE